MTAIRPRIDMEDTFFQKGNQLSLSDCTFSYVENERHRIDNHDESESSYGTLPRYECICIGCKDIFYSIQDCEQHYVSHHIFECQTCHKHFPNSYLLDIHLDEAHDAYFKTMIEHQKTSFKCLVDTCSDSFPSEKERFLHLVDRHSYPKWFRFSSRITKDKETKSNRKKSHIPWNRKIASHDQSTSNENRSKIANEPYADHERKVQRSVRRKLRNENIPCRFYNTKKGCKRGKKCMFLHDDSLMTDTDIVNDHDEMQEDVIKQLEEDATMDDLLSSFARVNMKVPASISFGRKRR